MPQERLTMRKIREILRLKWECKLSERAIALSCSTSRSTVADYLKRAQAAGLSWPLPEKQSDHELSALLFPPTQEPTLKATFLPDWEKVHLELRRKGVTLRLLWAEYLEKYPQGYGYSQYCQLYRNWAGTIKQPTMRLEHKAGEKLFVDYAGQTHPVIDAKTGEIQAAQIFVAVLGASSYTYVEAHWHQDLPNWTGAHVRAFQFFGGVTEVVVPDNLLCKALHKGF